MLDTPEALAGAERILPETVLSVEGDVVAEPQAPGGVEIHNPAFEVLSPVREALPVTLNKPAIKANLPVFLDHAVVGLRHPSKRALFRLSAGVMAGFRATLDRPGLHRDPDARSWSPRPPRAAPMSSRCNYFERKAYLAQSPQFYKQIMVGVFERVFEVGPVFRAEPHDTVRHINEYVSLDAEMGFIRDHRDVMAILTRVIRGILEHLQTDYAPELALLEVELPVMPGGDPEHLLPRSPGADPASCTARTRAASRTWRRSTNAGWANGRRRSTAATSCS